MGSKFYILKILGLRSLVNKPNKLMRLSYRINNKWKEQQFNKQ